MLRSLRSPAVALALAVLAAAPLLAQKDEKIPARPELDAGADTNDAYAYYDFGLDRLRKQPQRAADAFYWASRLSPTWADPYYARRIALHLSDKRQLMRYLTSSKAAQSSRNRAIDSLYNEAMLRNLFEPLQGAASGLRHVALLQGTKAYGVHVRPMKVPARECRFDRCIWSQSASPASGSFPMTNERNC